MNIKHVSICSGVDENIHSIYCPLDEPANIINERTGQRIVVDCIKLGKQSKQWSSLRQDSKQFKRELKVSFINW